MHPANVPKIAVSYPEKSRPIYAVFRLKSESNPKSPFRTQKNRVLSMQFFVLKVNQTSLNQLKFQHPDKRKTSDFSEVCGGRSGARTLDTLLA